MRCTRCVSVSYSYTSATVPLRSSGTSGDPVEKKTCWPSSVIEWLRCVETPLAPLPTTKSELADTPGSAPDGRQDAHDSWPWPLLASASKTYSSLHGPDPGAASPALLQPWACW